MKRLIVGLILLMCLLVFSCDKAAPAPAPVHITPVPIAPVPIAPVLTNPESGSRIAELEAKIRQLQSDNQRLLAENQQLNSELVKVNAVLQNLQVLVNSSSYTLALDSLTEMQSKTGELAYFTEGLRDLPEPPIKPSKIEEAVDIARTIRGVIAGLPDLRKIPIIGLDSNVRAIEEQRHNILAMTEFLEGLRDLPQFISGAESLKELRSRIDNYYTEVHNTTSHAGSLLEELRDIIR